MCIRDSRYTHIAFHRCPAAVAALPTRLRPSAQTEANNPRNQRRRGVRSHFMPHLGAKTAVLAAILRHAMGWRECQVDPTDGWVLGEPGSLTRHMFMDYKRRYTCEDRPGEFTAGIRPLVHPRSDHLDGELPKGQRWCWVCLAYFSYATQFLSPL